MSTIDRIDIRHVDVERTIVIFAQPVDTVVSKVAAAIGHPGHAMLDIYAAAGSYAYRRIGSGHARPLLCLQHLTRTLDNWDPCEPEAVNGGRARCR